MASFVPVARRAPGVHAESGRPPCATHPEVLVCTPQCGPAPVVLLPAVGVVVGKVIFTEPQPLNMIVRVASSPSQQMSFFMISLLLRIEIGFLSLRIIIRGKKRRWHGVRDPRSS